MGDGTAIVPESGDLFAPVNGEVTVTYDDSKHAYGFKSDDGAEVLLHIGIDTVELKGKYFETSVTQGQRVNKGQKIGSFDLAGIKQAGYDPTVMIVVTNTADYASVDRIDVKTVKPGEKVVSVTAR